MIVREKSGTITVEMTKEEAEQLLAATASDLAHRWIEFERRGSMGCWGCAAAIGEFVEAMKKAGLDEICNREEVTKT